MFRLALFIASAIIGIVALGSLTDAPKEPADGNAPRAPRQRPPARKG